MKGRIYLNNKTISRGFQVKLNVMSILNILTQKKKWKEESYFVVTLESLVKPQKETLAKT